MRVKPVILAAIALVASIAAGGLYLHNSTNAPEAIVGSSPSAAVTRSDKGFSFSALEKPKPLPELQFIDGEGREMTLASFKGQTMLLNIWATWCVPCREEMPALDRLQAALGGPDFQVIPLSIDRDGLPAVKAFYQELGLEALAMYVDQTGKAARQLGVVGVPTTLLVDRDGNEVGRTVGPAEWDSGEVLQFLQRHLERAGPRTGGTGREQ